MKIDDRLQSAWTYFISGKLIRTLTESKDYTKEAMLSTIGSMMFGIVFTVFLGHRKDRKALKLNLTIKNKSKMEGDFFNSQKILEHVNVLHLNVQSLRKHVEDLEVLDHCLESLPHILFVSLRRG